MKEGSPRQLTCRYGRLSPQKSLTGCPDARAGHISLPRGLMKDQNMMAVGIRISHGFWYVKTNMHGVPLEGLYDDMGSFQTLNPK